MTKAKSASALANNNLQRHTMMLLPSSHVASARSAHTTKSESTKTRANDEWLHRAGLAIASETRLSKGQSWLVSRESSTSLVLSPSAEHIYDAHNQHKVTLMTGEHVIGNDHDATSATPRSYTSHNLSRAASRVNSRAVSRRGSRRGSRVGSKIELVGLTALEAHTTSRLTAEGYFDDVDTIRGAEPDFVDVDEDDQVAEQHYQQQHYDDQEVASLARQRGFGIGGLVDRLVSWTLFNVDEDAEESVVAAEKKDQEQSRASAEDAARLKAAALKLRREQLDKSASSSALATQATTVATEHPPPPSQDDVGSWKDAAWLLSVASKVIL